MRKIPSLVLLCKVKNIECKNLTTNLHLAQRRRKVKKSGVGGQDCLSLSASVFSFGSMLPILEIRKFVKLRQVKLIFFSFQIDWCYKLLATIWQNFFFENNFSNIDCKVSNLRNKIVDKRGQLALISQCQFDSGNII